LPSLVIGYFIPGVRHLAAYIAAINKFPFRKFVIFALLVNSYGVLLLSLKEENWGRIGIKLNFICQNAVFI
jgi:membrane protein DedA with SNARE-associated domain